MATDPTTPKPGQTQGMKRAAEEGDLRHVEGTETVHHESARDKRRKREVTKVSQLNLTSMLDVCFQLLIFFILTASFAVGEGILPADLPSGQASKPNPDDPPEQPINIRLKSLGGQDVTIQIDGLAEPPRNFEELFKQLNTWRYDASSNPTGPYAPDNPIIIHPESSVIWGHVVNTFNAAIRAKFQNVHFAQADR